MAAARLVVPARALSDHRRYPRRVCTHTNRTRLQRQMSRHPGLRSADDRTEERRAYVQPGDTFADRVIEVRPASSLRRTSRCRHMRSLQVLHERMAPGLRGGGFTSVQRSIDFIEPRKVCEKLGGQPFAAIQFERYQVVEDQFQVTDARPVAETERRLEVRFGLVVLFLQERKGT